MGKVMLTLKLDPEEASAAKVRSKLDLSDDELDPDFGVVELDKAQRSYAVLVDEKVAARVQGADGVQGPFANPPIEPFGPPQPGSG
jgi:hypothetical protein